MVLKRDDGQLEKFDLNAWPAGNFKWWMNVKSSKPVDKLLRGSFQLTEYSTISMVIVFVDFNSEDQGTAEDSH